MSKGKLEKRYLSKKILDDYNFAQFSPSLNGLICVPCALFCPASKCIQGQELLNLVTRPLQKYTRLNTDLNAHANKEYHKQAILMAEDFLKNIDKNIDVSKQIDIGRKKQAEENRKKMLPIIKSVMFCGENNIPLRGKDDNGKILTPDEDDQWEENMYKNDGNFRNVLRLKMDSGETALIDHFKKAGANAIYTSSQIQNEIIEASAEVIKEKLVASINNNQFFSVLADETTDISCKEQLSICIRYMDTIKSEVKESFIDFLHVTDLTGKGIAEKIIENLKESDLDPNNMVGQGYDGAAAMSGHLSGVQKLIQDKFPCASYFHCANHCLNLVISQSCNIPVICDAHTAIKSICNFVNRSTKRKSLMKQCIEIIDEETLKQTLIKLCETRWVERHDAVQRFIELFEAVLLFFEKCESEDNITAGEGRKEFQNLKRPGVLVGIAILHAILSLTINLSRNLQEVNLDLVGATENIDAVIEVLQEKRENSKKYFKSIWREAIGLAKKANIKLRKPRTCRKQLHRGNIEASSAKEYYRLNVFIPFLDFMLSQLNDRFSSHNLAIFKLSGIIPSRCETFDFSNLKEAIDMYSKFLPGSKLEIEGEFQIWKKKWSKSTTVPANAIDTFKLCSKVAFPNLYILLHILCTLPVTTATAERSFSGLKRMKTDLRSNMKQSRLAGLAHMHLNRNMPCTAVEVLGKFANGKRRLDIGL